MAFDVLGICEDLNLNGNILDAMNEQGFLLHSNPVKSMDFDMPLIAWDQKLGTGSSCGQSEPCPVQLRAAVFPKEQLSFVHSKALSKLKSISEAVREMIMLMSLLCK